MTPMFDFFGRLQGDQWVGILFIAAGAGIVLWGTRTLRGPASGHASAMVRAASALWGRATGAALVIAGLCAMLAGVYLLLDIRSIR
jgi:hypothetical protein